MHNGIISAFEVLCPDNKSRDFSSVCFAGVSLLKPEMDWQELKEYKEAAATMLFTD